MVQKNSGPTTGWPVYQVAPPFISLDWKDGAAQVRGQRECRLGRPVPRPDGGRPDGVYAGWSWDGSTLRAEVDPNGFYSLFLYQKGDSVALSPSILQLIAEGADPTVDDRALGVFYRLGLFINNDTPFRHIKALPPGAIFTWADGTANTPEDQTVIPPVQQIGRDEAVDGIIELTRQSLRNILGSWEGPLLLPLSGGRDSRHILLALDHLGRRPELCGTFQHAAMQRDSDAAAARALCERMRIPHRVLGKPRSRPHDVLRCQVLTSLCSDEHTQMMAMHDFLTGSPWAALDGIAGDILTNPDDDAAGHMRHAERGDYQAIARDMMQGHGRVIAGPGHPDASGETFAPGRRDEAIAYVGETVSRFADAADPYQAYWFWNRTRREIGFVSSSVFGTAQGVFCPFLDQDFVRFGLSLPFSVTKDQKLHDDALARGYPAYADVPFAEGFPAERRAGRSLPARLRQVIEGIGVLQALHPQHPLQELRHYLKGRGGLHRQPGEVLQLHYLLVSGMDAELARTVLNLGRRYRMSEPGSGVLSRYDPE